MMTKNAGMLLVAVSLTLASAASVGLDGFPGAEGFGRHVTGGRGGRILFVDNVNDDGPGSFRAAAEASGRRIIIFRTGGLVTLTRSIDGKPDAVKFEFQGERPSPHTGP
jgi:hypothetical protein